MQTMLLTPSHNKYSLVIQKDGTIITAISTTSVPPDSTDIEEVFQGLSFTMWWPSIWREKPALKAIVDPISFR